VRFSAEWGKTTVLGAAATLFLASRRTGVITRNRWNNDAGGNFRLLGRPGADGFFYRHALLWSLIPMDQFALYVNRQNGAGGWAS